LLALLANFLAHVEPLFLPASVRFIHRGPGATLGFVFGDAFLFMDFLNVRGLASLFSSVAGFVSTRHGVDPLVS
jgi:hypothetical protein